MMLVPAEPPVDIERDPAAEEARRELSKPIYNQVDDSLLGRAYDALMGWIEDLLTGLFSNSPRGNAGLVILLGLIALVVVVVLWRAGVLRPTRTDRAAVFGGDRVRTAAEYRAEAEAGAAAGRFGPAIRSRFRACVAELTERTILDDRPGRTAYEVVEDAGRAIPSLAGPLRPAAQVFAEVVYGGRPGTPERYAVVVTADGAARKASARSLVHTPEPAR
jgi:Domain of unknown function (DUF4129)